jgi:hypothetical protein
MMVVGAFAVAAVAAPMYAALSTPEATSTQAECLAWLGSKNDGVCIGNSLGSQGPTLGGGSGVGFNGNGIVSGPVAPGQTINIPLG